MSEATQSLSPGIAAPGREAGLWVVRLFVAACYPCRLEQPGPGRRGVWHVTCQQVFSAGALPSQFRSSCCIARSFIERLFIERPIAIVGMSNGLTAMPDRGHSLGEPLREP